MLNLRRSEDRGTANFGWLDSKHTFSFGHYCDPAHMGVGPLRVINEDRVRPGAGFDPHGHQNMEIISYVLDGALEHKDSIGNGSIIRPGDVQRMTAGTGIRHSEYNHSQTDPVHFLQIWILPEAEGLTPGYEQKHFNPDHAQGQLQLVASRDGRAGSLTVHQDTDLYVTRLAKGDSVSHQIAAERVVWLQVASGAVELNGTLLRSGDGASVSDTESLQITGQSDAHVLIFDMGSQR